MTDAEFRQHFERDPNEWLAGLIERRLDEFARRLVETYNTAIAGTDMSDNDLDPDAWARNFLAAYAIVDADAVRTDAQRQMFVAGWFRAAMQAAIDKKMAALDVSQGRQV